MKSFANPKVVSRHSTPKAAMEACTDRRKTQNQRGASSGWGRLHYYVQKGRGVRRYHVMEASR
jgi:hypothetical protein